MVRRKKNYLRKKMRSGKSTAKVSAKSQRTKEIWLWSMELAEINKCQPRILTIASFFAHEKFLSFPP